MRDPLKRLLKPGKNKMAKNQVRDIKVDKVKKKRKGVHSKCKNSHSKKSKNYKEVAITFDIPGIYFYQCSPHKGMGMIAFVVVGEDTSNLADIAGAKVSGKSKKKFADLLDQL